jgi:protein-S-isoprenylcysteine O-methyltransferase Ste14
VAWDTLSTVLVATCWGAVGVVWLAGAIYNARRGPGVRERTERDYFWLVTIVAVWLLYGRADGIAWGWLSVESPWLRAPGVALLVAATAFTLWARLELGTMWSASVVAKTDHALRTHGPYAVTRHPIYTGLLGMLLGTALVDDLGRPAIVFVLAVIYLAWKARAEERLLSGVFPEYERYRRRVPRLIPRPPHGDGHPHRAR